MLQPKENPTTTAWQGLSPEFIAATAIGGLTLVTYANVVSSFYLWADEAWAFGKSLPNADLGFELWTALTTIGRPTGVFIEWLQALTVEADLDFLIFQRLLSLAAVAAIAYLIYLDQPRRLLSELNLGWLPLCASLFVCLLPAAQVHAAFAVLLGASLGLILSFLSYRWLTRPFGWIGTTLALVFCMTIYQPSSFLILVAFTLDLWRRYEDGSASLRDFVLKRGGLVLAVIFAASLTYAIGFKVASIGMETELYPRARPLLGILNGDFEPFFALLVRAGEGLNVFEIWSYPPYVPYLWYMRYAIYLIVLIAIIALNIFAIAATPTPEERERRMWLTLGFAGAFGASLAPVIADGFSVRQNLYYPCQCLIVLNLAVIISFLARSMTDTRALIVGIALCIIAQSFMASASIYMSIIRPQLLAVDFVATKLRESGAPPGSKVAVAVSFSRTSARCNYEPCLAYFGRRFNADWEWTVQRGFYERVAERFGYEVVAYDYVQKPGDPRRRLLGEPLVVIDLDELRAIYDNDQIQM
jgi:hypothetical protein